MAQTQEFIATGRRKTVGRAHSHDSRQRQDRYQREKL